MDVTKPYEFIGFGAMDVTKPYEIIGFGGVSKSNAETKASEAGFDPGLRGPILPTSKSEQIELRTYEFIGFGGTHGPKPYRCMGFGGTPTGSIPSAGRKLTKKRRNMNNFRPYSGHRMVSVSRNTDTGTETLK